MFDRFAICTAYYLYAVHYHGGQFTRAYRIFGRLERIGFRARSEIRDRNDESALDETEREIYQGLIAKGY